MAKILIVYYSSFGHVETMAEAVAEGARTWPGSRVSVKRVPELVPEEIARQSGYKLDQAAPVADPLELASYDAIIFGGPTRFGNMPAQLRNFLDQTGPLWAEGKLIGKVGSAFTSSATQHGGQETTLLSWYISLLHHGMIIAGLPYSSADQMTHEEISGGSPYGATTLAGTDGKREVSIREIRMARFQGRHVAEIAGKMFD